MALRQSEAALKNISLFPRAEYQTWTHEADIGPPNQGNEASGQQPTASFGMAQAALSQQVMFAPKGSPNFSMKNLHQGPLQHPKPTRNQAHTLRKTDSLKVQLQLQSLANLSSLQPSKETLAYGSGLRTTSRTGMQPGEAPSKLQQLKSPANPKGPSQSARHVTPSPGMKLAQSSKSFAESGTQRNTQPVTKVKYQIPNNSTQGANTKEKAKPAQPPRDPDTKEATQLNKQSSSATKPPKKAGASQLNL